MIQTLKSLKGKDKNLSHMEIKFVLKANFGVAHKAL